MQKRTPPSVRPDTILVRHHTLSLGMPWCTVNRRKRSPSTTLMYLNLVPAHAGRSPPAAPARCSGPQPLLITYPLRSGPVAQRGPSAIGCRSKMVPYRPERERTDAHGKYAQTDGGAYARSPAMAPFLVPGHQYATIRAPPGGRGGGRVSKMGNGTSVPTLHDERPRPIGADERSPCIVSAKESTRARALRCGNGTPFRCFASSPPKRTATPSHRCRHARRSERVHLGIRRAFLGA